MNVAETPVQRLPAAQALFRAAGLVLALLGLPVAAQGPVGGDGKPWMLALAAITDENSYDNILASFHLGLGEETWLSLTGGTSRAPSTAEAVRADLLAVGIEHDFGPLGIAFDAERWGDDGELEARDWGGELYFRNETLRIGLELERRDIDVYFSDAAPPTLADRRAEFEADGIGIGGRLRLAPRWRLYGSWMDYDYPVRLRLIPLAERLDLIGPSALTLALGFVDEYSRIGIERAFGLKLVNLDFGSDIAAIDGSRLRSVSAAVLWPVATRMDLEIRLGSSRVDDFPSSIFGGLTLLIYGGG